MIADTGFLIDIMDGDVKAVEKLKEILKSHSLIVTTPSLFELFSGVAQSKCSEAERERVKQLLEDQPLLQLDASSAEQAGYIDGTLIRKGIRIEPIDCQIAGIALTHQQVVVTRNTKHFSRIENLRVESY
jgi:hypothetical protein